MIGIAGMQVRVEIGGMFGTGSCDFLWPGFSAYSFDWENPLPSRTGYPSFLGIYAEPVPGYLPDTSAAKAIHAHVERDLKGKLELIGAEYRARHR